MEWLKTLKIYRDEKEKALTSGQETPLQTTDNAIKNIYKKITFKATYIFRMYFIIILYYYVLFYILNY